MREEHSTFDDLLQSPFEPSPSETRETRRPDWWPIVAGVAVGAVAILVGYLLTSGDSSAGAETTTSTTVTSTTTAAPSTAVPADVDVAFPPGFVAVTSMTAVKPEYIIDTGDELVVAFTSATRRGFDTGDSFDGGDWILETASGDELTAGGINTSVAIPGGFSVQFAKDGEVTPERIRLVNRWEIDYRSANLELSFTGVPFETTDTAVDLGGGVTLDLDRLSLGEFDGEIEWSLTGAGDRGGSVDFFIAVGSETRPSALYLARDNGGFNPFAGADLGEVATEGLVALTRLEEDGPSQDAVFIDVAVTLVGTLPSAAEFDLTEVPGLNR